MGLAIVRVKRETNEKGGRIAAAAPIIPKRRGEA